MKPIDLPRPQGIALFGGLIASLLLLAGIYFGSGRLERFDAPLAAYAIATLFAAFGVTYRYLMWIQMPPTWRYFISSFRLFFRRGRLLANSWNLLRLTYNNIIAQKFIARRGRPRWVAHMSMAWGCLIAFLITFPLSWGWIQFGADKDRYVVEFMGTPQFSFVPGSLVGWLMFNGLNISAVLVLLGVGFAMHRRLHDHGAQAVQTLSHDFVPLFLLFAVSVTGLMITADYKWMQGSNFTFISLLHAFTVILFLLYLPFGKFFHIIQRPAQIGVQFYKAEGARGEQALSRRTGEPYQSKLHHDDLASVMRKIGFDFGAHQNLSPQDKRKLIALNQMAHLDDTPFVG